MARPQRNRRICSEPKYKVFAPQNDVNGSSDKGRSVVLSLDEYEVIRMVDLNGSTHEQCASHMGVSRTTVTEIYERARKKIADMIINGKELTIEGGNYSVCQRHGSDCKEKNCNIECGCI